MLTRRRLTAIAARQDFLRDYLNDFGCYMQSGGSDEAVYLELTERAPRMLREMGSHGVFSSYRAPFGA